MKTVRCTNPTKNAALVRKLTREGHRLIGYGNYQSLENRESGKFVASLVIEGDYYSEGVWDELTYNNTTISQ